MVDGCSGGGDPPSDPGLRPGLLFELEEGWGIFESGGVELPSWSCECLLFVEGDESWGSGGRSDVDSAVRLMTQ